MKTISVLFLWCTFAVTLYSQTGNFWEPTGVSENNCLSLIVGTNDVLIVGTNSGPSYGGIFRSSDNGTSWQLRADSTLETLSFTKNSQGVLFAGTHRVGVHRSTDNGVTWFRIDSTGLFDQGQGTFTAIVFSMTVNANDEIFLGASHSSNSGIFRSTNGGVRWEKVSVNLPNVPIYSLAVVDSGYMLAGTSNGIYRSTNGGVNWSQVMTGNVSVYSFVVGTDKKIYAGASTGVFRSLFNGSDWNAVGLSGTNVRALAINSLGHIYAGTTSGVSRSTTEGNTWEDVSSGLTVPNTPAIVINSSGKIFAATWGGGVHRSVESTTSVNEKMDDNVLLGQNYPNPFSHETIIPMRGWESGTLEIRDMLGRKIYEKEISAGENKIKFDGSLLPDGIYFYMLGNGERIFTNVMIKVK